MSTWAIIVAAGSGDRLGADRPKAFARLGGRPLLAESLERLDASDWVDAIVVAAPEGWEEPAILLAEELSAGKVAQAVTGGASRAESVRLAMVDVPADAAAVLVHDAARPLLPPEVIDRVLEPLGEGWEGVVPALPVADTIKRVERDQVLETLVRDGLVAAQTPQAFAADVLRAALAGAIESASDCASLVEARGGRVKAVEGDPRLKKVTTAQDLLAVEAMLAEEAATTMIVDYHMHLRDEAGTITFTPEAVRPFLATALARGVDEIGFTEHVYYFRQTAEMWDVPYLSERCVYDLDDYCDAVLEAKRQGLPVKLGLEVDYVGEQQARLAELLEPYPFDFLLGSVHWLDGMPVDMSPGVWEVMTVDEGWERYIYALCELAVSKTVDVLAHPDLAKIFGRRPDPVLLAELHERAALAAAASGLAVEISTAGLRKPVGELYPDLGLLQAFVRAGALVTLASDAHEPDLVGENFDQALAHARAAGCQEVAVFDAREQRLEPLG